MIILKQKLQKGVNVFLKIPNTLYDWLNYDTVNYC